MAKAMTLVSTVEGFDFVGTLSEPVKSEMIIDFMDTTLKLVENSLSNHSASLDTSHQRSFTAAEFINKCNQSRVDVGKILRFLGEEPCRGAPRDERSNAVIHI